MPPFSPAARDAGGGGCGGSRLRRPSAAGRRRDSSSYSKSTSSAARLPQEEESLRPRGHVRGRRRGRAQRAVGKPVAAAGDACRRNSPLPLHCKAPRVVAAAPAAQVVSSHKLARAGEINRGNEGARGKRVGRGGDWGRGEVTQIFGGRGRRIRVAVFFQRGSGSCWSGIFRFFLPKSGMF